MLTPLQAHEFPSVRAEMIERYAHDQVRCGRWQAEESIAKSEAEFNRLLPQGWSTPTHHIYAIACASTEQVIGTLWVNVPEGTAHTAFICDLQIRADWRRKGYARKALVDLEALLQGNGVSSIGLHAFSHNSGAISLYEQLGFRTTSINMHKALEKCPA